MSGNEDHREPDASHYDEDENDFKPPFDDTPPIDESPNISGGSGGNSNEKVFPAPVKPAEKPSKAAKLKGLFAKKEKPKADNAPRSSDSGDEGKFDKFKGILRIKKKSSTTQAMEEERPPVRPPPPNHMDPYSKSYSSYPQQSPAQQTAKKTVASYVKRPPPNLQKEGCAEVKPPPKKSFTRCSVFLVVLLIAACVAGIIMASLAGDNKALKVLGPFFIGVSLFALIGKVFFTLFWNKEAHPMLKPAAKAINKKMRAGPNYQQQSPYPLDTYMYPRSSAYNKAYDASQSPVTVDTDDTMPSGYLSQEDFTTYSPTSYHEEHVSDDYPPYSDNDNNGDYKLNMEKNKDFDEGGQARFI